MQQQFSTILDNQGDLQNIGGLSYLVEIVNSCTNFSQCGYYAKIVAEKAMLRRLISVDESVNQAYEASKPADEIIAQAEKDSLMLAKTPIVVVSRTSVIF